MINFGLKIKQLLDRRGETYEQAGRRLGMAKSNIFLITKKPDVSTKVLKDIAAAYDVTLSSFFSDNVIFQNQNTAHVGENGVMYNSQNQGVNEYNNTLNVKDMEINGLKKEVELLRELLEHYKNSVK